MSTIDTALCIARTMHRLILLILLGLPALATAQSTLDKLAAAYGSCVQEVSITPEDEVRHLGQRATHETLVQIVKIGKCQGLRSAEEDRLRQQFVRLGTRGAEAISALARDDFVCELGIHAVLDVEPATKKVIPAEQAVYECRKPMQGMIACGQFIVRLMPSGQAPGTTRARHLEIIEGMQVVQDVLYAGCR